MEIGDWTKDMSSYHMCQGKRIQQKEQVQQNEGTSKIIKGTKLKIKKAKQKMLKEKEV